MPPDQIEINEKTNSENITETYLYNINLHSKHINIVAQRDTNIININFIRYIQCIEYFFQQLH